MKIIHCADLHLDSPMESKLSKEKSKQRKYELLENFNDMVNYAKENNVKVILMAGDLFDNVKKTTKTTKKYILDIIRFNHEIDFIYLKGNHDEIDFLGDEDVLNNLKIFNDEWSSYIYDDVVITGIELNNNKKNIYNSLDLKYEDFNIVVLHGQIDKSINSKDKTEIIYLNELKNKNIDYLALGHIHKREEGKLDNRGVYCYSGCLEGRSFDECGEKGFILLDIEKGKCKREFIINSKRTIHEININISKIKSQLELENKIENELAKISSKDLVRVKLIGDCEVNEVGEGLETYLQIGKIESKYKSDFYYFEVKNESKSIINWTKFENDISLKGEFIRLVKSQNWDEEEKDAVCLLGIKAIFGGEI